MADSGKKKRLVTLVGLLIVLLLGALWLAGNVMQSSRGSRKEVRAQAGQPQPVVVKKQLPAPAGSAANLGEGAELAMVRKKLPQPSPAPELPPSAAPAPPRPKAPEPEDAAFGFLAKFPRQKVDAMFGKIAIEQRMVTHEQVAECIEIQSFMEPPVPLIGVLLMRKGFMKRPDVYRVLEMVGKRLGG
jgi:hypothetical protein